MSTMQNSSNQTKQTPTKRAEQKQLRKEEKRLARKQKQQAKDEEKTKRSSRRTERKLNKVPKRRLIPVWLKLIIVIVLSFAGLIGGLMVGFGILGDGNPTDVLEFDTWKHIWDIVFKEQ